MISSNGEGAGWTGLASVAMVGSLRDFDWPRAPFWTCWHVGRETLRGWSAVFCVDRQSISVKRAHLPASRLRSSGAAVIGTDGKQTSSTVVPEIERWHFSPPPKVHKASNHSEFSQPVEAAGNAARWASHIILLWPIALPARASPARSAGVGLSLRNKRPPDQLERSSTCAALRPSVERNSNSTRTRREFSSCRWRFSSGVISIGRNCPEGPAACLVSSANALSLTWVRFHAEKTRQPQLG
jgi:hypothetical protein